MAELPELAVYAYYFLDLNIIEYFYDVVNLGFYTFAFISSSHYVCLGFRLPNITDVKWWSQG